MVRGAAAAVVSILLVVAAPASAASLYKGPGPKPGPALLYAKPKPAPQLSNRAPWKAKPILISGASAYRSGEFVYQDWLFDDNGAQQTVDPGDGRTAGNLFSKQNGTYTYPTAAGYANNAADLVELRVKPVRRATAFRISLNTLKDAKLVAFTIALGGKKGELRDFPFGANVKAPADKFVTVHSNGKKLVGELTDAATGKPVAGAKVAVRLDMKRRQIEARVPTKAWNPGRKTVRLAAGVGLWDVAGKKYLVPGPSASATAPGGAGSASAPAAFFNVAFRGAEPMPKVTENSKAVTDPAWWRDRLQGHALAAGDISPFFAAVNFNKLRRRVTDNRAVPKTGPMDRIYSSSFEQQQGNDYSQSCISMQATCKGQYQGRLQPYAIYIPKKPRPATGYGLTLLLHSLSATYNQYLGSRNQSQFGERGPGSIVITPLSRGPDEFYENYGAADVFDVWADVARRFKLDPDYTVTTGYSMGGIGSFKLGAQFPDLFAKIQPTVGDEGESSVLASLRNVPVYMWNTHGDELVNEAQFQQNAHDLDTLGYRYTLNAFQPCANPLCSPLFPNHLELAINDQFQPMADWLGTDKVDRNPFHVTYVVFSDRNHKELGLVGDHAYWVGGLKVRSGATSGKIDAISHGFGAVDPVPEATAVGTGTLDGGNMDKLTYTSQSKKWGPPVPGPKGDTIDVNATGLDTATINVKRAQVDCSVALKVTTDGPLKITLAGCNKTLSFPAAGG